MRMPVDDLLSNWAYKVMSALAWNLKAWYGLLMPNRQVDLERSTDHLSNHGLQQLAQRLLC